MEFWTESEAEQDVPLPQGLAATLEEITDLDKRLDELGVEIKRIKARRSRLEDLAVEEFKATRMEGVKVAGRTWRIETDHHLSVSFDKRDEVLAACQELGLDTNVLTTVNTAKLKAMLKEAAQEAGKDSSLPFSQGTALEGICGEFTRIRLRHRSS
tara:strand:- start:1220 stop:1687 length:468 start_codon:yes stop_codon:yes gene_type:complete